MTVEIETMSAPARVVSLEMYDQLVVNRDNYRKVYEENKVQLAEKNRRESNLESMLTELLGDDSLDFETAGRIANIFNIELTHTVSVEFTVTVEVRVPLNVIEEDIDASEFEVDISTCQDWEIESTDIG